jgi:putative ABC transport system ATP-binding protein
MKVIEIKNLEKVYNETSIPVYAVNGIDLSFERGEFSAIVGPSGCGKTTLLNLIGGLDYPTKGEIVIGKTVINNLKEKDLIDFRLNNIGFVFQDYNLIPVLTAEENIEFILELQGWDKKKIKDRSSELLESVGLYDRRNNKPSELSGGQQQRVAVARALAPKPEFVLADEPTANLDSKSTENLLQIMENLNSKENVTFIFATHDNRVMKRAHRMITLEDGKIVNGET